ncbi:hypothetical protein SAMN05444164_6964 [Bradyrhizobium erythrophlei]|uniref:Uncharacterized protein n=1 Tax=Bradyrhizobium erythrophlei TaxID=1437360 RepID=A0A1H5G797_9BRAD|nr:hypothetical protein SAMN05444164_6964 [Bradyrhizobium erythrophlei]
MKECRVILAGNALDDEPAASVFSAQSGSCHRTIGKCYGRCHRKTEWVVQAYAFPALWQIDHFSDIAICEALMMTEFYVIETVAFLTV